jgi:tetratricopeptide (TPR) repeat protein
LSQIPPGREVPPGSDATATGLHAQAELANGSVLGGRYRIEGVLGVGGMGVVYRATDLALDVPVALKLLRPELAHRDDAFARFRQELLLARQVSSPRVVRIHDLAQHDGRWLISMDFVDSESLDRRLDRDGALPAEDALRIARQVAEGLAAAHAKGVVHRDLKPANILLDAKGNAYISDFGVARSLATSGQTRTGAVVGTPDYLSPEQARGVTADARSDLYALGLMLYEMLAGALPFAGGTVAEVLAQRMLQVPPPVTRARPDLPPWVARLVDRLLRPQPAHRFQSASDVLTAIDTREVPRRLHDRVGRRTLLVAAVVAMLAVFAAGGLWWTQRQRVAALVASPPLDRLLVLPIAMPDGPTPESIALSAHLRDALASVPGVAVADRERSLQAVRQLDPDGNATPRANDLRRVAAARRVLLPRLLEERGRWHVHALLSAEGPALAIDGPVEAQAGAALQAWLNQPATTQALGIPPQAPLSLGLPRGNGALASYGTGLQARDRGALAAALVAFAHATAQAPDYTAAWKAQADTATMIGEQDKAADAIEQGQRAAAGAPETVRRRFVAMRAQMEGDAPAAVAQWRAVLAATPDDTDAELNLARAQGAGGDYGAAVATLQQLTRRDGNDPRAWFELGKFSILSGNAQRAVDDHLVHALVLFKRSRDLFGQAETVNALGIGYSRLGQTADAIEQYRKAVDLRHALGNVRGEATSLRNLGNALSLTGRFDEAAADLAQARTLHQQLGDRAGLAAVENDLGLLAEERGDFVQALAAFQRALAAWQAVGDPLGAAQAQNDIGFAKFQLGDYGDAQVYLQQAANEYARLGDGTGQVRADQDLGQLAIARGRWSEARQRLERSLASAQSQQMAEEAAVSRRHLAELELRQGHVAAAIAQAQRAEASFREREDARGESDAALLRIEALLAAHATTDAQQALQALQPTLAKASSEQQAIARVLGGELALARGDRATALASLRDARALSATSGIRQLALRIALLGARLDPPALRGLDAPTASLGNIGLRLHWLQLAITQAFASRDVARAQALYREASALLRNGDMLEAAELHALGARALAAAGDESGARAAQARADDARKRLRAALPASLQPGFDAAIRVATP